VRSSNREPHLREYVEPRRVAVHMGVSSSKLNAPQLRALALIATAQLFALSLWFSASAVADSLVSDWGLRREDLPWLTVSVQIGFVVGALGSALLNLADRVRIRYLFAWSATLGAAANLIFVALGDDQFVLAVSLRVVTGLALAGVYPSGMKAIAGWFREQRGMALGVLIAALTVGSSLPHLIRGIGLDWQIVMTGSSALALIAAGLMLASGDGPFEIPPTRFAWSHLSSLLGNRGYRLATIGYLGHMWELYAAWTWVATFVAVSSPQLNPSVVAFAMIAIGGMGSWLAGSLADRRGRTLAAGGAMVISGLSAAATAAVFGGPGWLVVGLLLIWGTTVVADSAQFSAMVTEVSDDRVMGTALTLQTALGFLLTLGSIWAVPAIAISLGWQWSFLILVPGPLIGTIAMKRLRRSPWAAQLAGGRG